MDGISRSRGRDKEIPHCILPMEQLVLSDKWARKQYVRLDLDPNCLILKQCLLEEFLGGKNDKKYIEKKRKKIIRQQLFKA